MAMNVIGLLDDLGEAQGAVRELIAAGIDRNDIGFLANQRHAIPGTPGVHVEEDEARHAAQARTTSTLAGAGAGAAVGGIAGAALALASIAVPGLGALLAAGPVAAALAGAGVGAVAGGIIGNLVRLGVSEEQAHYYAEGLRRGGILVTVATDTQARADLAAEILQRHGAVDIDERATEWKKQGWKGRFT